MKKTKKPQTIQKKLNRLEFWRKFYILPLFGASFLLGSATVISLIVSLLTGNFAITSVLALTTFLTTSTTIACYKLYDNIDKLFYEKILKYKKELDAFGVSKLVENSFGSIMQNLNKSEFNQENNIINDKEKFEEVEENVNNL